MTFFFFFSHTFSAVNVTPANDKPVISASLPYRYTPEDKWIILDDLKVCFLVSIVYFLSQQYHHVLTPSQVIDLDIAEQNTDMRFEVTAKHGIFDLNDASLGCGVEITDWGMYDNRTDFPGHHIFEYDWSHTAYHAKSYKSIGLHTFGFVGSYEGCQCAIANLRYMSDIHYTSFYDGPDQIVLTAFDFGGSGIGGEQSGTLTLEIEVTPVNDNLTLWVPPVWHTIEDTYRRIPLIDLEDPDCDETYFLGDYYTATFATNIGFLTLPAEWANKTESISGSREPTLVFTADFFTMVNALRNVSALFKVNLLFITPPPLFFY